MQYNETPIEPSLLWYGQSARCWEEALPLGCGRLGMMVYGGTAKEILQLNEETLWSGYPAQWNNPDCLTHLEEMRTLLFQHRYSEAQALCCRYLVCRGNGSDDPYYGSYQTAGELVVESPVTDESRYRRSLDLNTGLARTAFGCVERTHLTSEAYGVTASQFIGGSGSYTISFAREDAAQSWQGTALTVAGQQSGPGALSFCTVVQAETDGQVRAQGGLLHISGARKLILWTCTATSYRTDADPLEACLTRLTRARAAGWEAVCAEQARHTAEVMGRCRLHLPADPACTALPIDQRLERLKAGGNDLDLIRLYFDFGRYLLLSSAGGQLPANLQGIWSREMQTPWAGDYHTNINLQMNYWMLNAVGLEEYGEPLYRYLSFLAQQGAQTARVMYGCRGWVIHTITNPWGFTAPGQDPAWGSFHCAGAWCCRHLWEHYRYTGDLDFLRRYWPMLRDCAQFYADFLVPDPETGELVTAPSNSPENHYIDPVSGQPAAICAGPTMDNMILRELFRIVLQAAHALGESDELTRALPELLRRLPPTRIGRTGNIQEWREDFQEAEPGHRHISQLYGLYPGTEITPEKTPELAQAARVTLERRLFYGGGHTGWSRAWVINFFARLWDGAAGAENLRLLLAKSTLPNLFDTHPPFQIDGNLGGAAGILEMLVQSHDGIIRLLPALPPDWTEGALEGVRVRGGFILSFAWKGGQVTGGILFSRNGGDAVLSYDGRHPVIHTQRGQSYALPEPECSR